MTGCGPNAFGCSSDEQCQADGAVGTCEPNGFCSFPDPSCPSGRRYGDLAGGGNAGECATDPDVAETEATSGASASATASSATSNLTDSTSTGSTSAGTTTPPSGGATTSGSSSQTGDSGISTTEDGPACDDRMLNGGESDLDCGGPCPGCSVGQMCSSSLDCLSGLCAAGVCAEKDVGCNDGILNGGEQGVDCGGACEPCGLPCATEPARWNPADAQSNIEFLEDSRAVTVSVDSVNDSVRADTPVDDRHYWEVEVVAGGSGWVRIGTADTTMLLELGPSGSDGFGLAMNGSVQGVGASGLTVEDGDIVGVAVDVTLQRAWVHVNGAWGFEGGPTQSEGTSFGYDESTSLFPALTLGQGDTLRANFGNEAFAFTIPPGFVGGVCD